MQTPHPGKHIFNDKEFLKRPIWYKTDTWRAGYLLAWAVMYEELRDGIGHYPVAILVDHETENVDYVPANNVSFNYFQP